MRSAEADGCRTASCAVLLNLRETVMTGSRSGGTLDLADWGEAAAIGSGRRPDPALPSRMDAMKPITIVSATRKTRSAFEASSPLYAALNKLNPSPVEITWDIAYENRVGHGNRRPSCISGTGWSRREVSTQ